MRPFLAGRSGGALQYDACPKHSRTRECERHERVATGGRRQPTRRLKIRIFAFSYFSAVFEHRETHGQDLPRLDLSVGGIFLDQDQLLVVRRASGQHHAPAGLELPD
jgi:hypothetical protein